MGRSLYYTVIVFLVILIPRNGVSQQLVINTKNIELLIEEWNIIHNARSLKGFTDVYDQKLLFYTERMNRKKAISLKEQLFTSKPDYRQRIVTGIKYSIHTSGVIKCEFIKEAWQGTEWESYSCYLLVAYKDDRFWIVGESDYATDKSFGYVLDIGEPMEVEQLSAKVEEADSSESETQSTITTPAVVQTNDTITIRKDYVYILIALLVAGGLILFLGLSLRSGRRKRKAKAPKGGGYPAASYEQSGDYVYGNRAVPYEQTPVINELALKNKNTVQQVETKTPVIPERPQPVKPVVVKEPVIPVPETQPEVEVASEVPANEESYHIIESRLKQSAFRDFVISLFQISRFSYRKPKIARPYTGDNEDDLEPILEFYSTSEPGEPNFGVQTLYKEDTGEPQLTLFSEASLEFVRQFAGDIDLYYVIGVGGPPEKPNGLYLIPSKQLKNTVITKDALKQFRKSGMFVYYHGKLL